MRLIILAITLCASLVAGTPKPTCDRKCPKIYWPVCGSDGKKYNNKCLMVLAACEQGKHIYPIIGCPRIMKPLCGSDGKRYNSPCELTLAKCKTGKDIYPIAGCPRIMRPVCGSDGKKYNSPCEVTMAACKTGKDIHPLVGCPKIMRPVCGSDGKKYNNKCLMVLAACEQGKHIYPIIGCPRIMNPVCGSDGKKYNSPCEVTMAACKTGKDIHPLVGCPRIMLPVCGSDGKRYNSPCEVTMDACKTGKDIYPLLKGCPKILMPVCGSDGKKYDNKCLLTEASCATDGGINVVKCEGSSTKCRFKCTEKRSRVCGSNGKTYRNKCQMRKAACKEETTIIAAHDGKCEKSGSSKSCRFPCTEKRSRVCGSNGKTYKNECKMRKAACQEVTAIVAVHGGKCKKDDDKKRCKLKVTMDKQQVCGSDGKVYDNEFVLLAESCKQRKAIINVGPYDGKSPCSECIIMCTKIYLPVCGSDGKTHSNLCVMKTVACESQTAIVAVHDGECK